MQRVKDDTGAVAVIVAIAMVALLGMATIVVDVGQVYAERRQLQNGADAAALAVVLDCAEAAGCPASTTTDASSKANQNANDGSALLSSPTGPAICGSGGGLPACAPVSGIGPWDCRPLPSGALSTASFVQVRTRTLRGGSGDTSLLPPFFAKVLNPGYAGTAVRACARASWGSPAGLEASLALTISYCEWDVATNGGTAFAPPPPYPPNPPKTVERVLKLQTNEPLAGNCPKGGHSGSDAPGAFGWLDDGSVNDCATYVDDQNTYKTKTGEGVSAACKTALAVSVAAPYPVLHIPVFDTVVGNGDSAKYTLRGFAAFVLTGYDLPGAKEPSWLYPGNPEHCSKEKVAAATSPKAPGGGKPSPAPSPSPTTAPPPEPNDKCLYGFFTKALIPTSGTIGGPSMGVTVVQLSG